MILSKKGKTKIFSFLYIKAFILGFRILLFRVDTYFKRTEIHILLAKIVLRRSPEEVTFVNSCMFWVVSILIFNFLAPGTIK